MKKAKDKKGKAKNKPIQEPSGIIGREHEFELIREALTEPKDEIINMYLCGKPGTGKSYTMSQVLKEIRSRKPYRQRFSAILEVNGMELKSPSGLWEKVNSLLGVSPSPGKNALMSHLQGLKKPVLLVIDEFENLIGQKRLGAEILSLPFHVHKLALISISNRVDLPRSVIPDLDTQPTVVVFPPYPKSDIQGILQNEFPEYDSQILEICARQVAKTGDIRKGIEMCGKAMKNGKVTLSSTLKAVTSWTSWELILKALPSMQKAAILSCKALSGHMTAAQMHAAYKAKCRKIGAEPIEINEFLLMLNHLQSFGVVSLEGKGDDRKKTVVVNVELDNLIKACEDVPEIMDFYHKKVTDSWKFKA